MSSVSLTSSLPRAILRGIKDNSGRAMPLEEESLPIHLPWFPILAEWGPEDDAVLVGGNGFAATYGSKSFEERSKFFTHQSMIAKTVISNANMSFIRRLVPADASFARLRLALDVVETTVPVYQRNVDETYRYDNAGMLQETGETINGIKARWVLIPIDGNASAGGAGTGGGSSLNLNGFAQSDADTGFGQATPGDGFLVGEDGRPSTLYPIMDIEARFPGAKGNNIGIRIAAPTLRSTQAQDADLVEQMGAFIYRMWVVQRDDVLSTPRIVSNMFGEQFTPFCFRENTVDRATEKEYFIDDVLLSSYESNNPEEFTGYGPLKRVKVYHDNVDDVLQLIYGYEKTHGTVSSLVDEPHHAVNLFGAQSATGVPYYSFQLMGPNNGGLLFTETSNHWCINGSDGTITPAVYDQLVREELNSFGEGMVPYMDSAKYPFSCMYDSGFTIDTKKAMAKFLQRRDAWIVVATQDAARPLNSPSEESSMAVALRAHFRAFPESEHFGTRTVRVLIVGHAGQVIGSKIKSPIPFTLSLADKSSKYMGAGNGYMNSQYEFDTAPGNIVSNFIGHNATFKPEIARNRDWNNGLIFAQNFDRKSIFWPGLQTIYDDPTSILNSYFNMVIACNLTRIGERAWRRFVGDSKRPNEVFIGRIDEYITEQTNGRYDGRVDVIPRSYYTAADEIRGYSWHTDITFRGQGIKTVETLTIISERREAAENGTA